MNGGFKLMDLFEEIVKKFKDVLTESDLEKFSAQLKSLIAEEAQKRADLVIEEKTKDIQTASEKYVTEAVAEAKLEIAKDYDSKMEQLEEKCVVLLDQLFDKEISEKISEEMITKIAINETLSPVVEGIKKVFADNLLDLDSEGASAVTKLKVENESLSKELSKTINEKLEFAQTLETISVKTKIAEKTAGLSDVQVARVSALFEGKKFKEVETGIDSFIEQIIAEENKPEAKKDVQTIVEGDGIKEIKKVVNETYSSVAKAAKQFV
jgi:hypothetical protein